MQAVRVIIDILALGGVQLHYALLRFKEHIFDGTHLLPGGAGLSLLIAGANTHVIPSAAVRRNNKEGPAINIDLEASVPAISIASHPAALCFGLPVFIQRM